MRPMIPLVTTLAVLSTPVLAQQHEHPDDHIGTAAFSTSCAPSVRQEFNRGVTLLHSFAFSLADTAFSRVLRDDPSCAMAWWGLAVSAWGNPVAPGIKQPEQLRKGQAAVRQGRAAGRPSARETGYLEAVARLYERADSQPQRDRLLAYRDAMDELARREPADTEAMIFAALARVAAADPTDKTFADQLAAGATLDRLWAAQPDHPGLAHYIIHAYDVPPLAARAEAAARRYSGIAPAVSHALHMPSHTWTRIGAWQRSIESNRAAGEAARREGSVAERLHTMDYRMYAYLQTGQDQAAQQLRAEVPGIAAGLSTSSVVTAAPPAAGHYATAAIPARWALERGAWDEAARLEPTVSPTPYADALTWFARGLGAARTGDTARARAAAAELARLRDVLAQRAENYWANQVDIQRRSVTAWLDFTAGRRREALDGMRDAADREGATEKAAVTPGPLAPARELLGEMLLAAGQPAEALAAFEVTLQHEPNRFRTTALAARAAMAAGNSPASHDHYRRLLQLAVSGDRPGRPELAEAARVLQN